MVRFHRFLTFRMLLAAGVTAAFLGPLVVMEQSISTPKEPMTGSFFASDLCVSSNFPIQPVEALSGTFSSPKRPPRIRPKRQSPSQESPSGTANPRSKDDPQPPMSSKHEQALKDPSLLTNIRFSDRTDLHPHTRKALIEGFGLQTMTRVQAETFVAAREGQSVLARSKTGTGKTLAFLLPVLERLLDPDQSEELYRPGRSIGCVVLAPTRELAIQIADQAQVLADYHNQHRNGQHRLSVACIYGGVKMQRDVRLLTGSPRGGRFATLPTILVATPSRLLEHLDGNSPLNKNFRGNGDPNQMQPRRNKKSQFASIVAETKIVVLDETDRLLQKSNQQETQRVLSFLARPDKRQTLLFSATFPRAVRRLLSTSTILNKKKKQIPGESHRGNTNGKDFLEVDCIGNEATKSGDKISSISHVHSSENGLKADANPTSSASTSEKRVEESFVVLDDMSEYIPILLTILRREQEMDIQNYKILVFFPAGRLVRFLFQFFTIGGLESKDNLWEIHSRMSQSSRTRASNSFRSARRGILFSSDVSARGLDYPDISLVVQMGAPSSDQDYIHRIGRTGRAGKVGRGILVLLPFENLRNERQRKIRASSRRRSSATVSYRNDANLKEDYELASWLAEPETDEDDQSTLSSKPLYQRCKDNLESTRLKVRSGHVVLTPGAEAAYKTFLAHYMASNTASSNWRQQSGSRMGKGNTRVALPPSEILSNAEDFVQGTGLAYIPELDDEFTSKLGL